MEPTLLVLHHGLYHNDLGIGWYRSFFSRERLSVGFFKKRSWDNTLSLHLDILHLLSISRFFSLSFLPSHLISSLSSHFFPLISFLPSHLISSISSLLSLSFSSLLSSLLSHEMRVDRQKLLGNCDFEGSRATLWHEMRVDRQKLRENCDFEVGKSFCV